MTSEEIRESREWMQRVIDSESLGQNELEVLRHYYNSTKGLYCIDKNPNEVDIEWIRKNAFRLE